MMVPSGFTASSRSQSSLRSSSAYCLLIFSSHGLRSSSAFPSSHLGLSVSECRGERVEEEIRPETFDEVLHSAPRITIMSRLVVHRSLRFAALQQSTTLSSGNLATHLRVLEEAGCVTLETPKNSVSRHRTIRVTPAGEARFRSYIDDMKTLLGRMTSTESPG